MLVKINTEEGPVIGEDPLLDEAGALDIFPEFEWAQAEGLCNCWMLERTTSSISLGFGICDGEASRSKSRDNRGLS